jgi:hypothetical protein
LNLGTGIIGAPKPPPFAYVDGAASASNATSYDFGSRAIGTAHKSRVLVMLLAYSYLTSGTFGSVTVGGVTMNLRSSLGGLGTNRVYTLAYPTGTTANVIATSSSGTFQGVRWQLWSAFKMNSETPLDSDIINFGNPNQLSLDVQAGGFIVGMASGTAANTSTGYTWTGANEDAEFLGDVGNSSRYGAAHALVTATGSQNIQSASSGNHGMFAASFR